MTSPWYARPDWWILIAAIITFAAVFYQAWATAVAAKAAKMSADVARENVSILVNSERAWVFVELSPDIPEYRRSPDRLTVYWFFPTIRNLGKGVATLSKIVGRIELLNRDEELSQQPNYPPGQGFNQELNQLLPSQNRLEPRLGMSSDEYLAVLQGQRQCFIHGFVEYSDGVSNKPRRTAYCWGFVPQGGFSPSPPGF